jgi:hypothetical protein
MQTYISSVMKVVEVVKKWELIEGIDLENRVNYNVAHAYYSKQPREIDWISTLQSKD